MNLPEIPHNGWVVSKAGPGWQKRFEQWRELLAKCGRKPGKGRVHALRVATLRLKAELDDLLRAVHPSHRVTSVAASWNSQAGKLRKVLSEVRETDVYLAKLKKLRRSLTEPDAYQPRTNRATLSQLDRLERRLMRQRKAAARKLISRIANRRQRLLDACANLEQALGSSSHAVTPAASSALAAQLTSILADYPELESANLHAFRKRIKMVRYLAELYEGQDPAVDRMAVVLRRMQRAIGEWHDWEVLAKLAARRTKGGLVEMLRTLATESLAKALDLCQRETLHLAPVPPGAPRSGSQTFSPRRPVRGTGEIKQGVERSA